MAGVIPPIFAQSIILFPSTIAQFFGTAKGMGWFDDLALALSPGQPGFYDCLCGIGDFFRVFLYRFGV